MYFFNKVFAQNGDVTLIPKTSQGDGKVSYDKGWEEGYEIDPNVDPDEARNLSRTNFNGLFFNITSVLQQFQKYGVNPYINATDNEGIAYAYNKGGMCSYIDPSTNDYGVYYSLKDNNSTVPSENGITTKFWQRIFQADVDMLKSNRVGNSVLYMPNKILYDQTGNTEITFTIPAGTKFLFSDGWKLDGTMNTYIVYFQNNVSASVQKENVDGLLYICATNEETCRIFNINEFSTCSSQEDVINEKGEQSPHDVYFFDSEANSWYRRAANSKTFESLEISFCVAAIASVTNGIITTFETEETLTLVSNKELRNLLARKQQVLQAGKYINMEATTSGTTLISADVRPYSTPFCVNSCNLDINGDTDLLYTDAIVQYGVWHNTIDELGTNGTIETTVPSSGVQWGNSEKAFGTLSSSNYAYVTTNTTLTGNATIKFTFSTPVEISQASKLEFYHQCSYVQVSYSYSEITGYVHYWGCPHPIYTTQTGTRTDSSGKFTAIITFTDNTEVNVYSSSTITQDSVWKKYEIDIPAQYVGKTILSVTIDHYMYNVGSASTSSTSSSSSSSNYRRRR